MKKLKEHNNNTATTVKNAYEIGRIVRYHREKANLTQFELAELSGAGKTVIFDIEKGKSTVKLETLLKVFKSLNISVLLDSPVMGSLERLK